MRWEKKSRLSLFSSLMKEGTRKVDKGREEMLSIRDCMSARDSIHFGLEGIGSI